MNVTKKFYGKTQDGKDVYVFTITNSNNASIQIINYGARVISLKMPDKNGKFDDVVLGFDRLEDYVKDHESFGAILGRCANRIANARFEINGIEYKLAKNDGQNHLHGGIKGFGKVVWDAEVVENGKKQSLKFSYISKDGEEGYPGNLKVNVIYSLSDENAVIINYYAISDKDTVVNLTNHSYFNLSGHKSGDVSQDEVMINADKFTVSDKALIPTGELMDVEGTPMDFRKPTKLIYGLKSGYDGIVNAGGYDHNWALNVSGEVPEKAAYIFDPKSGRVMEVYTTCPGMQMYTGNGLEGTVGKENTIYKKTGAVCFETQYFPNAINEKKFLSPLLKAGKEYKQTTIYKFSTRHNK